MLLKLSTQPAKYLDLVLTDKLKIESSFGNKIQKFRPIFVLYSKFTLVRIMIILLK